MKPVATRSRTRTRNFWNGGAEAKVTFGLQEEPGVQAAGVNPLVHYLQHDQREGRYPSYDAKKGATLPRASRPTGLKVGLRGSRGMQNAKGIDKDLESEFEEIPCLAGWSATT